MCMFYVYFKWYLGYVKIYSDSQGTRDNLRNRKKNIISSIRIGIGPWENSTSIKQKLDSLQKKKKQENEEWLLQITDEWGKVKLQELWVKKHERSLRQER